MTSALSINHVYLRQSVKSALYYLDLNNRPLFSLFHPFSCETDQSQLKLSTILHTIYQDELPIDSSPKFSPTTRFTICFIYHNGNNMSTEAWWMWVGIPDPSLGKYMSLNDSI